MYSKARWAILFSAGVAIMSLYINMIVIAPILGDVSQSLNVDMGTGTNLMMGFVIAIGVVLTWGGVVCDKFGITTALILGLLCTSVPAALMPIIGDSYSAVFIARLIQGASIGFVFATIGPITALWFPPEEGGLAGGVLFGSVSLGSTIGVVISPVLFKMLGSWEMMVAVMSIPGWIAMVLAYLFTRKAPSEEVIASLNAGMASSGQDVSLAKAIMLPMTIVLIAVILCNSIAMYFMYNLIPPFLSADAPMGVGLPAVTAGNLALTMTSVGIIAPFIGGLFFDKIAKGNPKYAVIIGFILSGGFVSLILMPAVYSNMSLLIICLMLAGWGVPFMGSSLTAFLAANYPPSIVGRMIGACFGIAMLVTAAAFYFAGESIKATQSFESTLMMITWVSVIGIVLTLLIKRKTAS